MEEKGQNENLDVTIKDKYYLTQILFYALGVVSLASPNFFSTATDYWLYKFRDLNSNESYNTGNKTALQAEFISNNSLVFSIALVIFFIITVTFLNNRISLVTRVIISLSIVTAMFIFTCIFVRIDTDSWQQGFFVLTLITSFVIGGFGGIFMVTMFVIAFKFPPLILLRIFSGQAVCGIFAALTQIFALGLDGGPEVTALVYFSIGLFFVFVTLLAFLLNWKHSKYFNYYFQEKNLKESKPKFEFNKKLFLSALNKSKYLILSVVITLGCTVMLHPGVISLISSVNENKGDNWSDKFFKPVINFLLYNICDLVGRESANFIRRPSNSVYIFLISCCRVGLVPLILFCNAQPRSHLSVVVDIDYVYIIILIIFAFSSGYLVNLSLSLVPHVTNEKEKPFAMLSILVLMIFILLLSSVTSTLLVKVL